MVLSKNNLWSNVFLCTHEGIRSQCLNAGSSVKSWHLFIIMGLLLHICICWDFLHISYSPPSGIILFVKSVGQRHHASPSRNHLRRYDPNLAREHLSNESVINCWSFHVPPFGIEVKKELAFTFWFEISIYKSHEMEVLKC